MWADNNVLASGNIYWLGPESAIMQKLLQFKPITVGCLQTSIWKQCSMLNDF